MTVDYTQYDAETPLSGEYVSPTWERGDDEKDVAEQISFAFVAAVLAAKALDWSGVAKKWSDRGFRDEDLQPVHRTFTTALKKAASGLLVKAAGLGRQQALADFQAEFGNESWRNVASTWSSVYGNEMADQVAKQSHKAIADVIPQLINSGLRNDPLAQTIKKLYGLDPRSMNTAVNFMRSEKKPRNRTVLDLAEELLTRRANVIGDVQSFTGLNFGRQLTYLEAMDSGLMPKSARKVWVTAIDERVCKICKPMDGKMVGMMDTFAIATSAGTIRLLVPPVHPNCRCTVVPEERYRHGIITRRARFRDEGPRHRASLRSEVEDLVSLGKSEPVEKFSWEAAKHPRDHQGQFATEVTGAVAATGGGVLADEGVARRQSRRFVEGREGGGYWPNSVDRDEPIRTSRWEAKRFKPNEKELVRGLSLRPQDVPWVGQTFTLDKPAHFSVADDMYVADSYASAFNSGDKHQVVLHVPPGHAMSAEVTNAKWGGVHGVVGDFKVVRHEYDDAKKTLHVFLQAGKTVVAKFSPLQARDAIGRFAPVAGAAAAAYVAASNFPKVKDEQPKLPRHLKRVDRKVKSVKSGTYIVPRQYLDFHQRGQSFRAGNEAHINDMARVMRQGGYHMQPVTLHVYDNSVEVADGNHRVEAAYRAKVGFIPTKIVRMRGNKPVQRGVIPAWRQSRTNDARKLAASRYVGSLENTRRNPFRGVNQRLIAQDERKHQWHDKSRKRTIKPL